jgi:hypothetical protein
MRVAKNIITYKKDLLNDNFILDLLSKIDPDAMIGPGNKFEIWSKCKEDCKFCDPHNYY